MLISCSADQGGIAVDVCLIVIMITIIIIIMIIIIITIIMIIMIIIIIIMIMIITIILIITKGEALGRQQPGDEPPRRQFRRRRAHTLGAVLSAVRGEN